jgi:hypothetical protein
VPTPSTSRYRSFLSRWRTSRIGSTIGTKESSIATTQNEQAGSPSNYTIRNRTQQNETSVTTNEPSESAASNQPIADSASRASSSLRTHVEQRRDIASAIRGRKRAGTTVEKPSSTNQAGVVGSDSASNVGSSASSTRSSTRSSRAVGKQTASSVGDKTRSQSTAAAGQTQNRVGFLQSRGRSGTRNRERIVPHTRLRDAVEREGSTAAVGAAGGRVGSSTRRNRKLTSLPVVYHERPTVVRPVHRYEHVYRDRGGRIRHRIVWPRYRFVVGYRRGPHISFGWVYPYYLRRYMFVSLGGWWPIDYCYARYYWYGYHPYYWCGYYPVAREVAGDTYNYYTYNYYYDEDAEALPSREVADVRAELAQQQVKEPNAPTIADTYFEDAVKVFEGGDYDAAIVKFARAMQLAPDDIILPFAYSQALVAAERYAEAAQVLRAALAKVTPEKEGVFYPRGLYPDDELLFEQIDRLSERAELYSYDADLQLLLGYQLLGVGEIDEARGPLQRARLDTENAPAANVLLKLLEKIEAQTEAEKSA